MFLYFAESALSSCGRLRSQQCWLPFCWSWLFSFCLCYSTLSRKCCKRDCARSDNPAQIHNSRVLLSKAVVGNRMVHMVLSWRARTKESWTYLIWLKCVSQWAQTTDQTTQTQCDSVRGNKDTAEPERDKRRIKSKERACLLCQQGEWEGCCQSVTAAMQIISDMYNNNNNNNNKNNCYYYCFILLLLL